MNLDTYFKPLSHLINCELHEIKKSDALTILSYFSLIVPLVVLSMSCLKGRAKVHPPESPKPKTDSVAQDILNPSLNTPEAIYKKGF